MYNNIIISIQVYNHISNVFYQTGQQHSINILIESIGYVSIKIMFL